MSLRHDLLTSGWSLEFPQCGVRKQRMSKSTKIVRLSIPMKNLVQITCDGLMANLFIEVQDVPVGEVGLLIVKDVKITSDTDGWASRWEELSSIQDKAHLRIDALSQFVLQQWLKL